MGSQKVKFTESPQHAAPAPIRGGSSLALKPPAARDRLGWALYWSEQCSNAIGRYVENGNPLDQEYAVRTARMMWTHVCRAKGYHYWRM